MIQASLFDQPTITPKDRGIKIAELHQEQRHNGWQNKAFAMLTAYVLTVDTFITEDFRMYAESNGLEAPIEPRCYGALAVRAIRAGVIVWTGEYANMNHSRSHSCPKKVWRRCK